VLLVDHIDGTPAESTVRLGLGGVLYQIDLSGENNDVLRKALAKLILKGAELGAVRLGSARVSDTVAARAPSGPGRQP
jgi:hypothetical protein